MIGISSLDLLAFPLRHSGRRGRARSSTPARARCSTRSTDRCPAGVQRVGEPRCGSVDELIADLMARGHDSVCVGDGALRYRDEIAAAVRCEIAEQFLSHPSAAPLVQLAHARALREEWVNPWEIQPLYLRAPDAQINWSTRAVGVARWAMSVLSRLLRRDADDAAGRSSRCAAATSPTSWRSSRCRTRKPWSRDVFHERARAGHAPASATTSSPAPARAVVGYAGLMFVVDDAHVTNIAVAADRQRDGDRHPAAGRAGVGGDRPRLRGDDAGGAGQQHRRPGAVPQLRVRAGRHAPAVLREHRGRHRHVVPRHRRAASYADRLRC